MKVRYTCSCKGLIEAHPQLVGAWQCRGCGAVFQLSRDVAPPLCCVQPGTERYEMRAFFGDEPSATLADD